MEAAAALTAAVTGTEGHLVKAAADVTHGLPATIITGLPGTTLREARDRVRAAIVNSGERWPDAKITVTLYPVSLPKHGPGSDLAIAIAILAASGDLPAPPQDAIFLAELGLDGKLRPVPGVLPAALATARAGITTIIVAAVNQAEAAQAPGMTVIAADSLADVTAWLRGGPPPRREPPGPGSDDGSVPPRPLPDLADVHGQAEARQALEICAAGGHHVSLLGPAGAGKTMLAEQLPGILPPLELPEALEVTSIHSAAGALPPGTGLVTTPPFRAPHHTATKAAITGGGPGLTRPGEASLAHRGVLFLDQAPEFTGSVLDALRQPMEAGQVAIARAGRQATFPARFTLVLAARPCPCPSATAGTEPQCRCTPAARRRYLARLSGPLLDRIDVKVPLRPASHQDIPNGSAVTEPSAAVAQRVAVARERSAARLAGTPWRLNAEIPATQLRRCFPPAPSARRLLEQAVELGQVSARAAEQAARVAWTLADLAARDRPGTGEVSLAIALRLGMAP